MADDYLQPVGGYRFTQDSLWLADFTPLKMSGQAADLGAGCGVVGLEALTLGRLTGLKRLFFVETDELFRSCLDQNLQRHRRQHPLGPKLSEIWADWRTLKPQHFSGPLDFIMVNPPYFPRGASGPTRESRNTARHETLGDLAALLRASSSLMRPNCRMVLSWPKQRLSALLEAAF
jgi:tRNA1Val (adenine37-N6)-methyltransferase